MNSAEIRRAVSEFIDTEFDPELSLIEWRTRLLDGGWAAPLWPWLLYTSPSPRDLYTSRMPSSA